MRADLDALLDRSIGAFEREPGPWLASFEPPMTGPGQVLVVLADARDRRSWPAPLRAAAADGSWLGHEQRVRAARLRSEEDRTMFVVRHTLLRHFLGHLRGSPPAALRFEVNGSGKPSLPGLRPQFSISGRGPFCLLAFDPSDPVGADLELRRPEPDIRQIASWLFPDDDRACLDPLSTEECRAFVYAAWTLEEAAAKREGDGIAQSLRPESRAERLALRRESARLVQLPVPAEHAESLHLALAVTRAPRGGPEDAQETTAAKEIVLVRFAAEGAACG